MDMSMQLNTFNLCVVLQPTVCTKIKCRLRVAIRLIIMHGVVVEELHDGVLKLMFRMEDTPSRGCARLLAGCPQLSL